MKKKKSRIKRKVKCMNCRESVRATINKEEKKVHDMKIIETWFVCPNCHQLSYDVKEEWIW